MATVVKIIYTLCVNITVFATTTVGESQASWATKIYFEISCNVLDTDS